MWAGRGRAAWGRSRRIHYRDVSRQFASDRGGPRTQRVSEETRLGKAVRRFRYAGWNAGLRHAERGPRDDGLQAQADGYGKGAAGNLRAHVHAENSSELRKAPAHLRTGPYRDHQYL